MTEPFLSKCNQGYLANKGYLQVTHV
eukprot:COSAG02_NODE_21920_length_770_cov_0.910581_1_plen_25_part_01